MTIKLDEAKIDTIFGALDQCELPGAAVGIAIGGRTVYRKGFGLANMELPVTLSPSIRMRLYSVTKHFTCFAFLLLCEQGLASPHDPIGKYLPELHASAHGITPMQLMGNTSGLRDAIDIAWVLGGQNESLTGHDMASLYNTMAQVNVPPDTVWNYNNGGFLLLSFLIERISGLPLADVLQQTIFEPVGMRDTLLRRTNRDFVPNSASTHMPNAHGFDKREYSGERAGENGVVSTIDDMLRWLDHMDHPVIGNAATWAAMLTPRTLANGGSTDYGAGLFIRPYRGTKVIYHGGGGVNGNSCMFKLPEHGLSIMAMINRGDVDSTSLAVRIIDAIVPGLNRVAPQSTAGPVTGMFGCTRTGRTVRLFGEGGTQRAGIDNYNFAMDTAPDGAMKLSLPFHVKMSVTPRGVPDLTSVVLDDYGNTHMLERVSDTPAAASAVSGHYVADCAGIQATIRETEAGLRMETASRFGSSGFSLETLGGRFWHAKAALHFFSGIICFNENGDGFSFTTARSGAIRFSRQEPFAV